MVNLESTRTYISFFLLFTTLFVCTILTITPGSLLKHVQATVGMDDDMEGDGGDEYDGEHSGDGDSEPAKAAAGEDRDNEGNDMEGEYDGYKGDNIDDLIKTLSGGNGG